MKDERLYLVHILEAIERIQLYTTDGREQFLSDTMIQDAVLRNLQILSESTMRLSDSLKSENANVPWRAIAGFRNIVVHNYLSIGLNQVWDIVSNDIPVLKAAIEHILNSYDEGA